MSLRSSSLARGGCSHATGWSLRAIAAAPWRARVGTVHDFACLYGVSFTTLRPIGGAVAAAAAGASANAVTSTAARRTPGFYK